MPFKAIMNKLVDKVPGAAGAIFLDWEGEAVDQYNRPGDDGYHLKVLGAHKSVILNLIAKAQNAVKNDKVENVSIKMENFSVIMSPVTDEYSLIIMLKPGSSVNFARHSVAEAVKELRAEM